MDNIDHGGEELRSFRYREWQATCVVDRAYHMLCGCGGGGSSEMVHKECSKGQYLGRRCVDAGCSGRTAGSRLRIDADISQAMSFVVVALVYVLVFLGGEGLTSDQIKADPTKNFDVVERFWLRVCLA